MYDSLTRITRETLDVHAPLKTKLVRGNHARFMNPVLSKAIMTRSRYRSQYTKCPNINIDDIVESGTGFQKLSSFKDSFSLKSLIKDNTCYTHNHQSSIDVILTNRPKCFQKSMSLELGVSDVHRLILTCLKSHVTRLKPKSICYRNFKHFSNDQFLEDLKSALSIYDAILNSPY